MINTRYQLVKPYVVEARYGSLSPDRGDHVLVRPTYLSICRADLRYFHGQRSPQTLRERLPLCLIHEAVGVVLHDPTGTFEKRARVVCLPNIPGAESSIAENYRLDSLFRSSRADGFMQELLLLPPSQLVPYRDVEDETAAMTELVSVGLHAVDTFRSGLPAPAARLAIWGDGPVAFITAAALKARLPDAHLTVVGVNPAKLQYFTFVDEVQHFNEVEPRAQFDHAFECVGGQASAQAIAQMIDTVHPEGRLVLLGVNEDPVPVNTRMVLEKGLTLLGRSRSGREDFQESVRLMSEQEEFRQHISMMISHIFPVRSVNDIHQAFTLAGSANFKVVMDWRV